MCNYHIHVHKISIHVHRVDNSFDQTLAKTEKKSFWCFINNFCVNILVIFDCHWRQSMNSDWIETCMSTALFNTRQQCLVALELFGCSVACWQNPAYSQALLLNYQHLFTLSTLYWPLPWKHLVFASPCIKGSNSHITLCIFFLWLMHTWNFSMLFTKKCCYASYS